MDDLTVEMLARRWCVLSGNDPDKLMPVTLPPDANGCVPTVQKYAPFWKLVASDIVPMFAWVRLYIEFQKGGKDVSKQQASLIHIEH